MFALALAPLLLAAQERACPVTPVPPPAELAGWNAVAPLVTATNADAAGRARLPLGRAVDATLLPAPRVAFPVAPAKPGGAESRSGLFALEVERAGRYRVALSGPAWIEVVRNGRSVASVAHAHGPACTGIRKMVDFDLAPGVHLVEIAGARTPRIRVMAVRLMEVSDTAG